MPKATVNRFFIFHPCRRLATNLNSRYNPQPMHSLNESTPNKAKDRPSLLILCLILSVVLHLLVVFSITQQEPSKAELQTQLDKPTIVQLVDKPQQAEKVDYELDQIPAKPTPEAPETSRLAEANQRVEKETAPKGEDFRDQKAQIVPQQQPQAGSSANADTAPAVEPRQSEQQVNHPIQAEGNRPAPQSNPLPSIQKLTQLSPDTLSRISRNEQVLQEKIKQREGLETGDTVWLNLQRGLLISFFRRFRNQIEGVWNYPREAIEKEQQGTLLLKITVDKEGELLDVDLLNSSGSDILDFEAIQAVYRAAPFGPLGKHYPHPDLKIMAHFHYHLTGKFIYGRRR
jgi:protein TonB